MRIILTTLTIAFCFALTTTVFSIVHWKLGDFIYSFGMTFGFILIPLTICVFFFHFLLNVYRWTKRKPKIITQILTLWLVYNFALIFISIPDFIRHQNNREYSQYKSFVEYSMTNILEGFIIASIFAIVIPLLDILLKQKIIKVDTLQKS